MKDVFQKFVDDAINRMCKDPRIVGLAIGGSWISNEIDQFSDLDLVVVCSDQDHSQVLADGAERIKALGRFVSAFPGDHVGEPRLYICLFREPLIHVDVKFVALSDFHQRIENPVIAWERNGELTASLKRSAPQEPKPDPQWIEDRFWTWVHYAALKIGRGEFYETIGFLSFLRERVLASLAFWIHGKPVRGIRRVEIYLPEFAEELKRTLASHDKKSCLMALNASVEIYRKLRTKYPVQLRGDVEAEVMTYVGRIQ